MDLPFRTAALCVALLCWLGYADRGAAVGREISPADHELFEAQIRPLFERRCLSCHGEGGLGGLDLRSRAGLLGGGASGPVVALGAPDQSLLIQAVRHEVPKLAMPMTGPKLSPAEIRALEEWVRRGAPWPAEHVQDEAAVAVDQSGTAEPIVTDEARAFWSFRPLLPAGQDPGAIDRWIAEQHADRGLEPLPEAKKHSLLRRVTFGLIGLPPTPEELDAFLADESPQAWATVIDRLLASPHYGERWGRHWLDVARYGEDDGRTLALDDSGHERYPHAYRYRDWVVDAFNRDLPFPDFVKAQLAGDLLGEPERAAAIPGLGFLGIGPWYYDTSAAPIARADERHDRVDVTTRAFLGLTVGCARCHDHKYDAIPITDYYALAGIFANTEYHEYPIGTEAEKQRFEQDKKRRKNLREARNEYRRTESRQLALRLTHQVERYMMGAWKVTGEPKKSAIETANEDRLDLELLERFVRFTQKEPQHYPHLVDWQAMIVAGGADEEQEARAKELAKRFQAELLELLVEKQELEAHNEYLIARGVEQAPRDRKSTPMPNDFESFFDRHQVELETLNNEDMRLYRDVYEIDLDLTVVGVHYEPGLLRFWGWSAMRQFDAQSVAHIEALGEQLEALEDPAKGVPFAMGVRDREQIDDLALHLRGSPTNLGAPVPRHFPSVLQPGLPERYREGSGRLRLAEQIADHPLAARVWVNRVWQWHFGEGLVRTESNFGKAGAAPTHPELLDYLAGRFVASGGSTKALHREILLSAAYRRAASVAASNGPLGQRFAGNQRRDPDNRFLWRFPIRRLEAEALRDALLAVSGNLDRTVGGASVALAGEENVRRTVYGTVSRFSMDPFLQTFDVPNASLSAEARFVTNVPLQNLWFMNSDFVARQAKALAGQLVQPKDTETKPDDLKTTQEKTAESEEPREVSDRARIDRVYRLLYARLPSAAERTAGLEFLEALRFAEEPVAAEPTAAWVRYVRALLSANEFRFLG